MRTSLSFAAITGRAIEVRAIRGKRPKPGLQPQHLAAVHAAAEVCGAELKGAAVGSIYLSFHPTKPVEAGTYTFDIGTAGSANLVLQTLFPALSRCGGTSQVTIKGGTHNPMAPSVDYLRHVFAPSVEEFGWKLQVECETPGFFPKGGGRVKAVIQESDPQPILLESFPRDHALEAIAVSTIGRTDIFTRSENRLRGRHAEAGVPLKFVSQDSEGPSQGVALTLYAWNAYHRAGFSSLGERRKSMEEVTDEVYDAYLAWSTGDLAVDEHLGDQLAPLAALTPGVSRWRVKSVTEHLRTVLQVIEWFGLGETSLDEGTGTVRVSVPSE